MRRILVGALAAGLSSGASAATQDGGSSGSAETLAAPVDSLAPVDSFDSAEGHSAPEPVFTPSSPIDQAKHYLTQGRFAEALSAAQHAQTASPENFEAYYYVGMAQLGLHQYDAALAAAQRAQLLAPQGAQEQVMKLVGTINGLRAGSSGSTEAEVALADGLVAKAARIYDTLFEQNPVMTDFGLKAADLYANRLSQWADAGRVLNLVIKAAPESPEAQKAQAELARLKDHLNEAFEKIVSDSFAQDWPNARVSLKTAMAVRADTSFPIWLMIPRGVEAGDTSAVQEAIAELAKRGPLDRDRLASIPGINRFTAQPQFASFLADVLGNPGAEYIARNARPAVSPRPVLDRLVSRKELMYYIGKDCQAACTTGALFQVANVSELHRCAWNVNLGKPHYNQYSDQPTVWKVHWSNAAPVQMRSQFDNRTPWFLVGTEARADQTNSRYIGFVVKRQEDAQALVEALRQKAAYCMGDI